MVEDAFASLPDARSATSSPFRDEARIPLVGRDREMATIADVLARLLEGRPDPRWLALEGMRGTGVTRLVEAAARAVEQRGGVVLRESGSADLDLAADDRGTYDAGPRLLVLDDAHRSTDAMQRSIASALAAHAPTLVLTGGRPGAADRLARGADHDGPVLHLDVVDLAPDAAARMIDDPLTDAARDVPADWIERAVTASDGNPAQLRVWGDEIFHLAARDPRPSASDLAAAVTARLERRAAEDWARLSERTRQWLGAVAAAGSTPAPVGEVAALAGDADQRAWSVLRDRLLRAGIVHAPARGRVALTDPVLARWLRLHTTALPRTPPTAPTRTDTPTRPTPSQPSLPLRPSRRR